MCEGNREEKEQGGVGNLLHRCEPNVDSSTQERLNSRLLYLLSEEVNEVLGLQLFRWYCESNGMKGTTLFSLPPTPLPIRDAVSKPTGKVTLLFRCPDSRKSAGLCCSCFYPSHTGPFGLFFFFAHPLRGLLLGSVQFCSCDSFASTL